MSSAVTAYWWKEGNNLGDVLNPYILGKLSQRPVVWSESATTPTLLAIGSVIHVGHPGWTVWGSGCISATSLIPDQLDVLAVRGPATQDRLRKCGYRGTWAFGDPGLLLPLFSPFERRVKVDWGIIPHFVDYRSFFFRALRDRVAAWIRLRRGPSVRIINPYWPRDRYLAALHSCRCIASTSLHGLILADAYGIPNVWLTSSDNIVGGTFKFLDYHSSVGRTDQAPITVREQIPWQEMEQAARRWQPIRWDPRPLLESFPEKAAGHDNLIRMAQDYFGTLACKPGAPSR